MDQLGRRGNDQGAAEDSEQYLFGVGRGQHPAGMMPPQRLDATMDAPTTKVVTSTANSASRQVPPVATTANRGRRAAMAKSSSTSTDGTAGVSRLPSLRGSPRRRTMMPEDET